MSSGQVETRGASRFRDPALVGLVAIGAATVLHVHDPHDGGSYGFCPFLELTGRPCPGCGGLRAVNDLTRGDVAGAVGTNVLAVALVVVLAVAWVLWVIRRARGRHDRMIVLSAPVGIAVMVLLVLFWIARNTPLGAWLAP